MMRTRALTRQALERLGVRRMVVAIHDASFPSDEGEDIGRGAPFSGGGRRLFDLFAALGFDGVQLGPQGEVSRDNASPYDATIMSRSMLSLGLAPFVERGWLEASTLETLVRERPGARGRVHHAYAFDAKRRASREIRTRFRALLAAGDRVAVDTAHRARDFRAAHASWLEPYVLYERLAEEHAAGDYREWPALDHRLWSPAPGEVAAAERRRAALCRASDPRIDEYAFEQLLAHEQHAELRSHCESRGLALFGDLQIGMSPPDMWLSQALFLPGYALGAPPSRTNPDGQSWGYPVLDPERHAVSFVRRRMDKLFTEMHGLRIDHPHGLVCPWVYATDAVGRGGAVQHGARLFAAPDLPDHPALARFAVATAEQLDRRLARHADGWVRELSEEQVSRYARVLDAVVSCAREHGRDPTALVCEVLSTCPLPLSRVLARHGLGRFRITQKANLDDEGDVYRSENARPEDWIMVSTHDTRSIWQLVAEWSTDERARQARHLVHILGGGDTLEARMGDPRWLAHAKLAELFVSRAENVMIFFADLFGQSERYNRPGTIDGDNWSLRVPPDFADTFATDAEELRIIDLRRVLAMALRAKGGEEALALRLEQLPPSPWL